LCSDCPCKPAAPPPASLDILDPKDIAARMKAAGTFDKDEPWPGWNAGRKLIEKEDDDGIVEGYGLLPIALATPPTFEDFSKELLKKITETLGIPYGDLALDYSEFQAKYAEGLTGGLVRFHVG